MTEEKGGLFIPGRINKYYEPPDKELCPCNEAVCESEWVKISNRNFDAHVIALKSCSSTMDVVDFLSNKFSDTNFFSVISQIQTNGKGQHSHFWCSDNGNMHASLAIPFVFNGIWEENLLPLIIGNIVTESLHELGIYSSIKWPNDIMLKERKLGGILVEKKDRYYNVGIGINILSYPDTSKLESEFSIPGISLKETGFVLHNPFILWDIIFENIYYFFYKRLAKETPSDLINSLIQKLIWLDEEVFFRNASGNVAKVVLKGISEDGGLVLEESGRKKIVYSGRIRPVRF